jgi:hypothetical protein
VAQTHVRLLMTMPTAGLAFARFASAGIRRSAEAEGSLQIGERGIAPQ